MRVTTKGIGKTTKPPRKGKTGAALVKRAAKAIRNKKARNKK